MAELLWGESAVTGFICASGNFSEDDIVSRPKKEIDTNIQYWPIFVATSNELIGCCGLRPYKGKNMNWVSIYDQNSGDKAMLLKRQQL